MLLYSQTLLVARASGNFGRILSIISDSSIRSSFVDFMILQVLLPTV